MRIVKLVLIGLLVLCCLIAVGLIQISFFAFAVIIPILGLGYLVFRQDPDTAESESLRQSIHASTQDIQDILDSYEQFQYSSDPESVADRTLYRPALADEKCPLKAIKEFRREVERSQRFLSRLGKQLNRKMSLSNLERLLALTDNRYRQLKNSWHKARQAAKNYGNHLSQ